jgi:hypothetical protein
MKFNEPIRTEGIGRKQLAFNTGNIPSGYEQDSDNNTEFIINTAADISYSVLAKAKASAEATATSLKQDVQNFAMEITGVSDFYFNSGSVGVDIPWNPGRIIASNPLFWYNWYDRYIYVRKPGWYLVKCFLFSPIVNAAHEWGIKLVSNVSLNSPNYEVYPTYMDYQHTSKHPYVSGTALFNAPEQVVKNNTGGLPGFKIRLYSTNSNVNFELFNTYANLQVVRLSDIEQSTRLIL